MPELEKETSSRLKDTLPHRILGAGITIVLVSAVAIAFFVQPSSDDFCRAGLLPLIREVQGWQQASSPWQYAVDSWTFWTGRWVAMWFETGVLSRTNLTTSYPAILVGVWLLLAAASICFVRLIAGPTISRRRTLALAAGFYALYWSTSPGIGDGYYWFTGFAENVLPIIANVTVFAVVLRASTAASRWGIWTAAATLAAFIAPGLHELHSFSLLVALAFGAFCARSGRRESVLPWTLALLGAAAGLAVVILAPGNGRRAAFLPPPQILLAMKLAIVQLSRVLPAWILSASLLSATAWVFTMPTSLGAHFGWLQERFPGRKIWIIPAATIGLVALGCLGPSYAMSAPAPTRTLSGIYLAFLLGWFVTVVLFRQRFGSSAYATGTAQSLHSLSAGFLGLSLIFLGHVPTAIWELRTSAPPWSASLDSRFELLNRSRGGADTVAVPPAIGSPSLLFSADLEENAADWRNRCVAGYFEVPAVVRRAPHVTTGAEPR